MIVRSGGEVIGRFSAMACPCEVLVDTDDNPLGVSLAKMVEGEAQRIEAAYSRYRPGNIIDRINTAAGKPVEVDPETARLLNFAKHAYEVSDGLFDVTSGLLRRAWTFGPDSRPPAQTAIDALLPLVGWSRVRWDGKQLQLLPGMEIDLGGIAKEYAVDRAVGLIAEKCGAGALVNFGGDIAIIGRRRDGRGWRIGVEMPDRDGEASGVLELTAGAVATSGDSKRFVMLEGKRYGHILNPRTGWPVPMAPRSVTVVAPSCVEAGFLTTLAILQGRNAEAFLKASGARFWLG